AISANANFVIPDDDVPAVRLELEDGEEFATVVDVLEAARSRRLMLSTAHDVTAFGTRRRQSGMSSPSLEKGIVIVIRIDNSNGVAGRGLACVVRSGTDRLAMLHLADVCLAACLLDRLRTVRNDEQFVGARGHRPRLDPNADLARASGFASIAGSRSTQS